MDLKQLRVACRLTLREAARLTEESYELLCKLENGEIEDEEALRRVKEKLEQIYARRSRSCRS